jgi:hypothetical protein
VSITHLALDRKLPVAREIAAYQRHRIKRIRRDKPVRLPPISEAEAARPLRPMKRTNGGQARSAIDVWSGATMIGKAT